MSEHIPCLYLESTFSKKAYFQAKYRGVGTCYHLGSWIEFIFYNNLRIKRQKFIVTASKQDLLKVKCVCAYTHAHTSYTYMHTTHIYLTHTSHTRYPPHKHEHHS